MLTETSLNPKADRERITEIMFDTFNVPYLYLHIQAVLALLASGRTTGVVVDSGESISHVVPIFESYAIPHATVKIPIGGRNITDYLRKILSQRSITFNNHSESHIV